LCLPSFSFSISCHLFHLFLMSSSTWQNHLILGHPMILFPFNFNSNALLSILVLSTHCTCWNCCHFSSDSINKFWILNLLYPATFSISVAIKAIFCS
jgi:hypothetical protein